MPAQGNLFKKTRRRSKSPSKNVSVRPTPEQLKRLHERAEAFGFKSLSKYLIERGLREGVMIESADRESIERILFEIRKLGHNVNHIARWANGGGRGLTAERVESAMREVERVVAEVGEALGG